MDATRKVEVSFGVILTVAAVALAAVTAVALAVIFAPPFFATAALAGCAVYLAIGGGIGTVVAAALAVLLLKGKKEEAGPETLAPLVKKDNLNPSIDQREFLNTYFTNIGAEYDNCAEFVEEYMKASIRNDKKNQFKIVNNIILSSKLASSYDIIFQSLVNINE